MRNGRAAASYIDPESERFIVYADAQILRRRAPLTAIHERFDTRRFADPADWGFLDFPETAICFPAKPNQIPCSLTQGMAGLTPSYY
jgi:hypothetical protein